ncbi:MAG: hypothetical protein IPH88_11055 [Bacteroidales bacterium]|nr:hypothetical protein [Bacteroidales bacterium]
MKIKRFTLIGVLPILFFMLFFNFSNSSSAEKVTYPDSWGNQGFTLMQQSPAGVSLNFSVKEFTFRDQLINGESMRVIDLPGNFFRMMKERQTFHLSAAMLQFLVELQPMLRLLASGRRHSSR